MLLEVSLPCCCCCCCCYPFLIFCYCQSLLLILLIVCCLLFVFVWGTLNVVCCSLLLILLMLLIVRVDVADIQLFLCLFSATSCCYVAVSKFYRYNLSFLFELKLLFSKCWHFRFYLHKVFPIKKGSTATTSAGLAIITATNTNIILKTILITTIKRCQQIGIIAEANNNNIWWLCL